MDTYITSLEPDLFSTSTWMRTGVRLVHERNMLRDLGEQLGNRLKLLERMAPDKESDRLREELRKLYVLVGRWVEEMETRIRGP